LNCPKEIPERAPFSRPDAFKDLCCCESEIERERGRKKGMSEKMGDATSSYHHWAGL
jgi:hypothetical protein